MKKYFYQAGLTKINLTKPLLAALMLAGVASVDSAQSAVLPNGAELTITTGVADPDTGRVTTGSFFGMNQITTPIPDTISASEQTPIQSRGNIAIGTASIATGSHTGPINGTEIPAFDIWEFFGNTGMDYINPGATATGDGTLNFSGWKVTWNGIASIPMNARSWQPGNCSLLGCTGITFADSVAKIVWNGVNGDAYTLHYTATVPNGDPSGFGGVQYYLHLVGTVLVPNSPTTSALSINVAQNSTNNSWTPLIVTPTVADPSGASSPASFSTCQIVSAPSNGTISGSPSCGNYTPTAGYTGADSFTYNAINGSLTSNTATVSVTVSATPPPTATAESATATGTTPVLVDVTANDTAGYAGQSINKTTVSISTAASHGATSVNGVTGVVTYTATAAYTGSDTFQYTVQQTDAQTSAPAIVTVTVQATVPASSTGTLSPGTTAVAAGGTPATTGGSLTSAMVGADGALSQQCVGGCFDFQVTGLTAGNSVTVVLPLSAAIPANATYRKRVSGTWQSFASSAGNAIYSAAAVSAGVCPQAGSVSYTSGLTAGNQCVQLIIKDGGTNDADSLANGTVLDPGGVGVLTQILDTRTGSTSGGGCSLSQQSVKLSDKGDWLAMFGFLAWLGMLVRRRAARTE